MAHLSAVAKFSWTLPKQNIEKI